MNEATKRVGMTAAKVMQTQMQMLDDAFKAVLVHVPADEVSLRVGQRHSEHTIVARGIPMFTTRCDMLAEVVEVEGFWNNWPPPELKFLDAAKGKFKLVD